MESRIISLENDRKLLLDYIYSQHLQSIPLKFQNIPQSQVNVGELLQQLRSSPPIVNNTNITVIQNISPPKSNTPTLHSSLLPSPPQVATNGTPPLTVIPDTYGFLTKEQLHLASYETYLLINYFVKPADQRDSEEDDSFRIQMEISKQKHEMFIKMFTPPKDNGGVGQHPRFHSVTYRLWVLRHIDFHKFDSVDSMMLWWRRQLYVVLSALSNTLRDPFDEKSLIPPILVTLRHHCFNVESCLTAMNHPANVDKKIYLQAFDILDNYIGTSILTRSPNNPHRGSSSPPKHQLATEYLNEPVPYQFPLNTNMYEDLLFYTLFEFNNDEIVFVGNDRLETTPSLIPMSMALRISEPMSKICHLNCFLTSYQAELREDHFVRLKKSLDIIEDIISNNITSIQDPSFSTAVLLKLTLKKIAQWLLKLLSDVHSHRSEHTSRDIELACAIYVQSREMWNMLSSNKSMKTTESNFTSFITSSVSCHYSRLSKPYRPLTLDNFSTFIEQLIPEIKLNLNVYTKGFSKNHSNAGTAALQEFVNLYSMDLKVVFGDVYFLSPMVIQSVQTASQFQLFLQDLHLIPEDKLPPVTNYVSTVISSWCQNQEKSFNKWFENIFTVDKFTPIDKDIRHSSSVIDMFQMFYQTLATLSKMKGSLGNNFAGFIVNLSNMFNNCLMQYNQTIGVITNQKNIQYLYPPSANERIQKKGVLRKSVNSLATSTSSSTNSTSSRESQQFIIPPNILGKIQNQTILTLIVCLNNLNFVYDNVNEYVEHHSYNDMNLKKQLSDLFLPTQSAIRNSAKQLIEYIGVKVVFIDLKEEYIESAYVHPISQRSRIDAPLEALNPLLRTIYNNVSSTERGNDVLTAVCKAFLQGLEYILLYGGPHRIFFAKDTHLFEMDLETIKDYFLDRDEQGTAKGVQEKVFECYAESIKRVCNLLLEQSSEMLMECFNSGKAAGFGKEIVLAVLLHRNDKPARSFIKKKSHDHFYLSIKKGTKINFLTT